MSQQDTTPRARRLEPEPGAPEIAAGLPSRPPRRSSYRRLLFALAPLLALAAVAWMYFSGGRCISEENSYVGATTITVAPQVTGLVASIAVSQNQRVQTGATLFVIDPEPYRIALEGARAELGLTHDQIAAQLETYRALQQQAQQAEAALTYANQQLERAQDLVSRGVGTQASLDAAQRDQRSTAAALASAKAEAAAALMQIGGNSELPIEERPQYLAAKAKVETAERDLRLTTIVAPWSGIVTNVSNIAVGAFLNAGEQAISMVASDSPWVDANLRETDLTHVRPGNKAWVAVDAYPGVVFDGHVETINPASGAVFALIPPQNATGNWVKVVQRIPVRVAIETDPGMPQLRVGMSANVTIDTENRRSLATLWRDLVSWL